MNLDELAEQRLAGIPHNERGCYTKVQNAVRRGWWGFYFDLNREPIDGFDANGSPTVERLRAMTDDEILAACHNFGPVGLASLRELLGQ